MSNNHALEHARWEALWVAKGKVVRKDCGTDFSEALRIYTLAVQAEKPGATLRCKNVGFPPPDKYFRKPMVKVETVGLKKVRTVVHVSIMGKLNVTGVWWCPYCLKMRRFVKRKGYTVAGVFVPNAHMACPICGVSHEDFHVRRYNPIAQRIAARVSKTPSQRSRDRAERRRRRAAAASESD